MLVEPIAQRYSDRTDRSEAGLRNRHAVSDMARFAHIEIEREHRVRAALLGPSDQPAERAVLAVRQAGLGADDCVADFGDGKNIAHEVLGTLRDRQHATPQPINEIDLLHGVDTQITPHPEPVDTAADIAVAVVERIDVFLHPLWSDTARDLL